MSQRSTLPAHRLLCGLVTDDHGNEMQMVPPVVSSDTYEQGVLFWFDGFCDPDIFERHIKDTTP